MLRVFKAWTPKGLKHILNFKHVHGSTDFTGTSHMLKINQAHVSLDGLRCKRGFSQVQASTEVLYPAKFCVLPDGVKCLFMDFDKARKFQDSKLAELQKKLNMALMITLQKIQS